MTKLIQNGTLIDGTGKSPIPNGAVLIDGNRILQVGPRTEIELPNGGVEVIDAGGGWILPGLIDTHVHIMFEFEDQRAMIANPFSLMFYRSINYMRETLNAGITTIRDAGMADLGIKQAVERGIVEGPRMQISITIMSTTGGHADGWRPSGTDFLLSQPHPGMPSMIADGVDEVRKKVREILRAGADMIKICSTGGVMSPTDHPEFTQYSMAELEAIVEEARFRKGTKVMAHAQGAEGIKQAILAGVHSIEHGIFLTDEIIELMLERGTWLVPTLLAPVSVYEIGQATGTMPDYAMQKTQEVIEVHKASIRKAAEAGVNIAMGTDAGVFPHGRNLRELELMADLGMDPMDVIVASTLRAAECMEWDDQVGSLEIGKLADVVITSVDPLKEIGKLKETENIKVVVKDGRIVKDIRES